MTKEDFHIEWRGVDGVGFCYGICHGTNEALSPVRVDIAIPGRGLKPQPGPAYKILVNGCEVYEITPTRDSDPLVVAKAWAFDYVKTNFV